MSKLTEMCEALDAVEKPDPERLEHEWHIQIYVRGRIFGTEQSVARFAEQVERELKTRFGDQVVVPGYDFIDGPI